MKQKLFIFLALFGFSYFLYDSLTNEISNCKELEAASRQAIRLGAEECSSNEDCMLIGLTCPFDCFTPVKDTASSQVLSSVTKYNSSCMTVCPDCPKSPSAKAICINSRCQLSK